MATTSTTAQQKLLLVNYQSPGDIVALTAAVRDLHRCYPGRFITDVECGSQDLWRHNPYLTPLQPEDQDVRVIQCHYPAINTANQRSVHFLDGFVEYFNQSLDLDIRLSRMGGDIHLSDDEKSSANLVEERVGSGIPYWVISAGGKFDFTIKWWHFRRWQSVVDHFQGRLLFVQVGEKHHYHPPMDGALDLRGQTDLRDLIRLIYRAQGVVCPVTLHMHLAAAIECPPDGPANRPCVVVAGGREPPQWEAYTNHQFIHTLGMLPCCSQGGCWRSRSVALGDGDEKDEEKHLCLDTVKNLPRCMDMITPGMVIEKIEMYLQGLGGCELDTGQYVRVKPHLIQRGQMAALA